MATERPASCRSVITCALAAGSASLMTSSTPATAATAWAVAALSPVSSTGRRPRPRSPATAAAADGWTVLVTASAPLTVSSQLTSTAVQPASSWARHHAARSAGSLDPAVGEQPGPADDDLVAVHHAAGAQPGRAAKPSAEVSGTGSVRARAVTAAATACSEACSTEPA